MIITQARTYSQVSEPSFKFAVALAGERVAPVLGTCAEERIENLGVMLENGMSQRELSRLIDHLKQQPNERVATTAQDDGTRSAALQPGVYEVRAGEIYVVKPNRQKTRLYAKRLVEIKSDRLNELDEHVKIEFVYAPGAIYDIRSEHLMPLDRAKALTLRYGRCISCGKVLKKAQSVERGIGPVCIKHFRLN